MPAKRRSSKFIKQAPNPNAPAIVDVDADLSLLSGNAEKLGTDLIKISKSGNFQKISKLLAHVDAPQFVNQKDKLGWSSLMCACKEGHSETVSLLLSAGADIEAVDNNGYTSLMWASYKGREDAVTVLLDAGASVSSRNNGGWNAFMLAAMNGRLGVLRQLSEAGADPLVKNDSNRSVLDIADEDCKDFIRCLFEEAIEEENKRLAVAAEEEERQGMEQEEAEQLAHELAIAAEIERQQQLAEQEEQEKIRSEEEAARKAEEAQIVAAKAKKKAEAEQRALERARIAAEKAAAKEQRKLEMGEDYVSEDEPDGPREAAETVEMVSSMKTDEQAVSNVIDEGGADSTVADADGIATPLQLVNETTPMEAVGAIENSNALNQS